MLLFVFPFPPFHFPVSIHQFRLFLNLKQFPPNFILKLELTLLMQVLCGRLVRPMRKENTPGIGKTQNPLLVKAQQKINDNDEVEIAKSWFYIGSANLSPSAW